MNRPATLLILFVTLAAAQAPYRIAEQVLDGGGRSASAATGAYRSNGSVHQTTIGRAFADDGADIEAWIGYWHPRPSFVVRHDVGVVAIESPAGSVDTVRQFTPSATLANFGDIVETFDAIFTIRRSNGTSVYSDRITVILAPNDRQLRAFAPLRITTLGPYVARCSTVLVQDSVAENNVAVRPFKVLARPPWPQGWYEVASMPFGPSGRPVRRGGWLTYTPNRDVFHAAKGNKTGDFYSFDIRANRWRELAPIPFGLEGRYPASGAAGASDGERCIYATKGNNTNSFWCYDIPGDSWQRLADVPLGWSRKNIKSGDIAYVVKDDGIGYVYLLRGGRTEFWRYSTFTGRWEDMPDAPTGNAGKWDKGSWLCSTGDDIYAFKAKYNELWRFDVRGDTWHTRPLARMPIYNPRTGRSKKAKEGSSGAWFGDAVYALKGGNTQEFWKYFTVGDTWAELETIPCFGSSNRRVRIKDGADLAAFDEGVFLALKGTKSVEVWRYTLSDEVVAPAPRRSGVMAAEGTDCRPMLEIASNPAVDRVVLRFAVPQSPPGLSSHLQVRDAAGRSVLCRPLPGRIGTVELRTETFTSGVYFVNLVAGDLALTRKLVVQH